MIWGQGQATLNCRYYDVSDHFIDDAELDALNTFEEKEKGCDADCTGLRSPLISLKSSRLGAEKARSLRSLEAKDFRLASDEVSGSSESSGSDGESLGWSRDTRGWQWQLSELEKASEKET